MGCGCTTKLVYSTVNPLTPPAIAVTYCSLHSAAEELLGACKEMLRVYENGDGDSEEGHALAKMQAAVRKAGK